MATLDISEPMFAETIENNELVILDFWAEWCGPCKAYGPVYERVSEGFPDVVFGKINTEEQQALAGMFGIRSIPTTIAFKEGIGVFMQPGALPEDALKDLVEKLKELDMDEVRAELAAQEEAASRTPATNDAHASDWFKASQQPPCLMDLKPVLVVLFFRRACSPAVLARTPSRNWWRAIRMST